MATISIAYIQTPFQLRTFKSLLHTSSFVDKTWIVFYDRSVGERVIRILNYQKNIAFHLVEGLELDKNKPIMAQLKESSAIRSRIVIYKNKLHKIKRDTSVEHVIFFSEKKILTQLLIREFAVDSEIIAVDEGASFYVRQNNRDRCKKILYLLLTPLLFGFQYQYFRQYGTHQSIDKLILRVPSLRGNYKKNVQVRSFEQIGIQRQIPIVDAYKKGDVLIVTGPYSEINLISSREEKTGVRSIAEIFMQKGFSVVIRPHPAERIGKYQELVNPNLRILEAKAPFEDTNYLCCSYIVNFYSSVVIDIISSGYQPKKVISYNIAGLKGIDHLFVETYVIDGPNNLADLNSA